MMKGLALRVLMILGCSFLWCFGYWQGVEDGRNGAATFSEAFLARFQGRQIGLGQPTLAHRIDCHDGKNLEVEGILFDGVDVLVTCDHEGRSVYEISRRGIKEFRSMPIAPDEPRQGQGL